MVIIKVADSIHKSNMPLQKDKVNIDPSKFLELYSHAATMVICLIFTK